MKTTLKEESAYTIRLTVSLDKDDISEHMRSARQQASKDLSVDGFRKGNVPEDVASEHLSDDHIKEAALQLALEDSFSRAVREQQWDVVRTEELKVVKNSPQELSYTVLVRLWPPVQLGDLSRFSVQRKSVSVSDEQVNEALDTLRNMRATFLDKEGPIADGDRAEIDFTATKDGKPVPGAEGKNHPLIIGGKTFMPGFEEHLVGLRAGDRKEFDLTAPKDYAYQELAGNTLHFAVIVGKVQLVMRPDITDDFAKELKYDGVDSLKQAVRESVRAREQAKERDRIRLAIMDSVLGQVVAPSPEFLVTEETEQMIRRFESDLQSKGLALDLYLARLNKTRDDIKKQWKGEAERQVRMSLVIRQVIKDQRIVPENEEIESTLRDTLGRLSRQDGFSEDALDTDALRRTIADRIVTEKALTYLERTCTAA